MDDNAKKLALKKIIEATRAYPEVQEAENKVKDEVKSLTLDKLSIPERNIASVIGAIAQKRLKGSLKLNDNLKLEGDITPEEQKLKLLYNKSF